jgi:hypothetical protein
VQQSIIDHRRAMVLLYEAQVFFPAVVPDLARGGFYVFSAMRVLGHGETIAAALANAKAQGLLPDLPPRPMFRGHGRDVERRGEVVASCVSRTMADRIANALNVYNPNERGI